MDDDRPASGFDDIRELTQVGRAPVRNPLWTRLFLYLLGAPPSSSEHHHKDWRDKLLDSAIFGAIVVLLIWIIYLTYRAWDVFASK